MTYACVGFGYTFSDNLFVAFLVASVPTILALITKSVEEEIVAESA